LEPDWEPDAMVIGDELPSDSDLDRLIGALSSTPVPVDDLVTSTGLSVSTVQTLILGLDLDGRIEWSSGQLVALRSSP
jgi:DNA processing protein